jgi:hypothetical protein
MKIRHLTRILPAVLLLTVVACSDDLTDDSSTSLLPLRGGREGAAPAFQWTRAEDMATHATFIRNFGVGYSYNAVKGEFCNWRDIRCQVVDRNYCDFIDNMYGAKFYTYVPVSSVNCFTEFRWSQRDYVSTANMSFREEVDLGFYEGTRRKTQYVVENGVEESFYFLLREEQLLYDLKLNYNELLHAFYCDTLKGGIKTTPLLTASFREAVDHLRWADPADMAVVDSFINVWGTHVIVESFLGGLIDVELNNYVWRYKTTGYDHEITTEEFLGEYEKKEDERKKDGFTWIEHGKLKINARGGDQSTLTNLLGDYQHDGKATFSIDGIKQWRNSIFYDPKDEIASNIEMTDMRVVPIWWFIEYIDEDLAERVQAVVEQDIDLQRKLLGERNFFSVSFPLRYPKATCQVQTATDQWETFTREDSDSIPMVVNIVSGGRVVATVSEEVFNRRIDTVRVEKRDTLWQYTIRPVFIGGTGYVLDSIMTGVKIDSVDVVRRDSLPLWVAYPVYEGVVNQACGVGVDPKNNAYDVSWINGRYSVKQRKNMDANVVAQNKMFYINMGRVDVEPADGVVYEKSYPMAYYELSGGIRSDGSYQSTPLLVRKEGPDFFILTPQGGLTNIVGFTLAPSVSKEAGGIPYYYYRRNDNYHYIYNPNEMRYEE